jgi:Zn-dependent peptidase ImmA (M78 family)/transcriptional regulator with XRE-family HTH domain
MIGDEFGCRVAERVAELRPEASCDEVAAAVGLSPEEYGRVVDGRRELSAAEVARLADYLGVEARLLITGEPDPHRVRVAMCRRGADPAPATGTDRDALRTLRTAYRQANLASEPVDSQVPTDPRALVALVGEDYARHLADRIEIHTDVDVVKIPRLAATYRLSIVGRHVIVVPATGTWFATNLAIAHELGHLAARDAIGADPVPSADADAGERAALAYAAELLLPEQTLRAVDWAHLAAPELASLIWEWGVSTRAVAERLEELDIAPAAPVADWLAEPTPAFLTEHWPMGRDNARIAIVRRMNADAARRFPLSLQAAHVRLIEQGKIGNGTLAWMLGVEAATLDVATPPRVVPLHGDALAAAFGL